MYAILRGPGMNFWFYFLMLPLLLGVAVIALAAGSRAGALDLRGCAPETRRAAGRIFLGFPLPLKLTAWFLRTFGP